MALAVLLAIPGVSYSRELEGLFSKANTAGYNGYRVLRIFDKTENRSLTVVKRGKAELASIEGYGYQDSTRFAFFSLLGTQRKQLVVESYSGGGHCCTAYHIFDLGSQFRVLFDGDSYSPDDVGSSMQLLDLNKDQRYELVQSVMTFDYFKVSHAMSVFPKVVFAYDSMSRKYVPANRRFSSYLLYRIVGKERAVNKLNDLNPALRFNDIHFREDYYHAVLEVVLTYVYAGKEKLAWDYFDRAYKASDKREFQSAVRDNLQDSVIYRSIYR